MGTFFVFFSTAPRVLIGRVKYSELQFSLAFSTVAFVMIITTHFAKRLVGRWDTARSVVRGMLLLLLGAAALGIGQTFASPSFVTFVLPMWFMASGIVLTVPVTANGALAEFGEMAGSAVALYFCVQSLFVGLLGSLVVVALPGDTVWPLFAYATSMALLVLVGMARLPARNSAPTITT